MIIESKGCHKFDGLFHKKAEMKVFGSSLLTK